MFFFAVFGVENKDEFIGTCNNAVCPSCGGLGYYEVHKSYTCLHVFFVPTFKWNVRYFVKASCCGAVFELEPVVGKRFERDRTTEIRDENLKRINVRQNFKYCPKCRANVAPEYRFCPYCGGKL